MYLDHQPAGSTTSGTDYESSQDDSGFDTGDSSDSSGSDSGSTIDDGSTDDSSTDTSSDSTDTGSDDDSSTDSSSDSDSTDTSTSDGGFDTGDGSDSSGSDSGSTIDEDTDDSSSSDDGFDTGDGSDSSGSDSGSTNDEGFDTGDDSNSSGSDSGGTVDSGDDSDTQNQTTDGGTDDTNDDGSGGDGTNEDDGTDSDPRDGEDENPDDEEPEEEPPEEEPDDGQDNETDDPDDNQGNETEEEPETDNPSEPEQDYSGSSGGGYDRYYIEVSSAPETGFRSLSVEPRSLKAGEEVTVEGQLGNFTTRSVTFELDNRRIGLVRADSQGRFSFSFEPQDPGTIRLVVEAGEASRSYDIQVSSDVSISSVTTPSSVEVGESGSTCVDIITQTSAQVTLYHNGERVGESTADSRACFDVVFERGENTLRAVAEVGDSRDEMTISRDLYTADFESERPETAPATGGFFNRISGINLGEGDKVPIILSVLAGLVIAGVILRFF